MKRNYLINLENDELLNTLLTFSKKHIIPIYFGSISAISRILNLPKPKNETIVLNNLIHQEKLISELCNNKIIEIEILKKIKIKKTSINNISCFIFELNNWEKSINTSIEKILLDIRDFSTMDFNGSFEFLDSKLIISPETSNPEDFWNSLLILGHLPNFNFKFPNQDLNFLCGTIKNSPLYRFNSPNNNVSEYIPSFGSRLISKLLEEFINLPNFPFEIIYKILPPFLGYTIFENFLINYIEESLILYENFLKNKSLLNIELNPILKLILIFYPLFIYEKSNYLIINNFLNNIPLSLSFQSFVKMHKVEFDKSPFLFWFCFSIHCFSSELIFKVIYNLESIFFFKNTNYFNKWYLKFGEKYFKETLCFENNEECKILLNKI